MSKAKKKSPRRRGVNAAIAILKRYCDVTDNLRVRYLKGETEYAPTKQLDEVAAGFIAHETQCPEITANVCGDYRHQRALWADEIAAAAERANIEEGTKAEVDRLKSDLDSAYINKHEQKKQIETLQSDVSTLSTLNRELKDEGVSLKRQLTFFSDNLDRANEQIAETLEQNRKLRAALKDVL